MTTIREELGCEFLYPPIVQDVWRKVAQRRLSAALARAPELPFDDDSKIIFFSDVHRGDNSRIDSFKANKALYLHALRHYFSQGYTYIEVGDGDELWFNRRFTDVLAAHGDVYALLHAFAAQQQLHIIAGNHDTQSLSCDGVIKDGIPTCEGLILRHRRSGFPVFVVHGHQADLTSWRMHFVTRILLRSIWKKMRLLGLVHNWQQQPERDGETLQQKLEQIGRGQAQRIEQRIIEWAWQQQQMVICGHTHRATFAQRGGPPYFNTGSCIQPGVITGLEIVQGTIRQVRWTKRVDRETAVARYIQEATTSSWSIGAFAAG